jgi:hypothetical protein
MATRSIRVVTPNNAQRLRRRALHPGGINTELGRHVDQAALVARVAE